MAAREDVIAASSDDDKASSGSSGGETTPESLVPCWMSGSREPAGGKPPLRPLINDVWSWPISTHRFFVDADTSFRHDALADTLLRQHTPQKRRPTYRRIYARAGTMINVLVGILQYHAGSAKQDLNGRDETDSTFCTPTGLRYLGDTNSVTSCLFVLPAPCPVSELCGTRSVWDAHQW